MSKTLMSKILAITGKACVYLPNIPTEKRPERSIKYVSKVMKNSEVDDEMKNVNQFELLQFDPEQKYIIFPLEYLFIICSINS